MVKVVPAVFEVADIGGVVVSEHHPLFIVYFRAEQLIELQFGIPMLQASTVHQHHTGGNLGRFPLAS